MNFTFTPEQENFRKEIRDFLEEEIRKGVYEPWPNAWGEKENDLFTRHVAERGWIGITWPKQFGGQGRSYIDRLVLTEELMRYGAPLGKYMVGDRQVGPALIALGTPEQKEFFLPKIIKGEKIFALGLSEPEAGSDLGNVQTTAVEKDDSFIINGQKVWTSGAATSDYIYLVVKTGFDPKISKYRSISEFVVDLKTPGITIRPLVSMTGERRWNEVFFDDVKVPKTALIGKKNEGFFQIMAQLDYERSGIERLMSNHYLLTSIKKYSKEMRAGLPAWKQARIRETIANLLIKFEAGKLLIYRVAWMLDQKQKELTQYTSMAKAFGNRFEQELDNAAMDIAGLYGQLDTGSKWAILNGMTVRAYLFSPGHTIQAGTVEILLNLIAGRGLGLPRE